jgi:hypothetical protein
MTGCGLARGPYPIAWSHSLRNATAGSMREARHAGAAMDTAAVSASTTVTAANVIASKG